MRDKMETDDGREIYHWRKMTVEPVIGQIKENLGFRQFCLRGLNGTRIEINLVASVHNLKKIWKRLGERREVLKRNAGINEKNLDFVIFVEFYSEIEFIVGRARLLYEVERSEKCNVPERLKGAKAFVSVPFT